MLLLRCFQRQSEKFISLSHRFYCLQQIEHSIIGSYSEAQLLEEEENKRKEKIDKCPNIDKKKDGVLITSNLSECLSNQT